MDHNVESLLIGALLYDEEYKRKVIPHFEERYFEGLGHKTLFSLIRDYSANYGRVPTPEALRVDLENRDGINENQYQESLDLINTFESKRFKEECENLSSDWLGDTAERHCRDSAIYEAIRNSVSIIDGEDKQTPKEAIPNILQEALAIDFSVDIGHDYLEDAEERFDFYHNAEEKIELPLRMFNKITKGGLPRKALGIIVAPTGVGKTTVLTHSSAYFLMQGLKVLYVTMEMPEEWISKRVDATLLDKPMDDIDLFTKKTYLKRIEGLKAKTSGSLIVKEYPSGSFNAQHLRFLLDELKLKRGFVPDVIVSDYLNLHSSFRLKSSAAENSYGYVKTVAEEIRGVGQEREMLVLTATQTNREGQDASDFDLKQVGESHGISQTADFMIGMISTPQLEQENKIIMKQLKNRFGAKDKPNTFTVGLDRARMTLFDVDENGTSLPPSHPTNGAPVDTTPTPTGSDHRKEKAKKFQF